MKDNTPKRPLKIKATINYPFNTEGINQGDVVTVKPCETFTNGDICVLESTKGTLRFTIYLYNTTRRNAHGKPYKYFYSNREQSSSHGCSFLYGDPAKDRYKILGKVIKSAPKAKATPKQQATRSASPSGFDWPYFGVHRYDVLTVERCSNPPVGSLITILEEESGEAVFARLCSYNGDLVRIAGSCGCCQSNDLPRANITGKVIGINHDDCNATKANKLRKEILRLQSEDEAWANSTRIAELETEIFNLEHQPDADEDDSFEWPDVIGEEGEL